MTGLADTAAWDRARVDTAYAGAHAHAPLRVRRRPLPRSRSTRVTAAPGTVAHLGHPRQRRRHVGRHVHRRHRRRPLADRRRARRHRARDERRRADARDPRRPTTRAPAACCSTHTALDSSVTATAGATTRSSASPTRPGPATPPPTITTLPDPGDGRVQLQLVDVAGDRIVLATQFAERPHHDPRPPPRRHAALRSPRTRTRTSRLDVRARRHAHDEAACSACASAPTRSTSPRPSTDGRPSPGCRSPRSAPTARATSSTDGATHARARPGPDGAVTLHAGAGQLRARGRPGRPVRATPRSAGSASTVAASCDRDGDALTAALAGGHRPAGQRVGRSPTPTRCQPVARRRPARSVPGAPRRHRQPTAATSRAVDADGVRRTALRRRPPHLVRPPLPLSAEPRTVARPVARLRSV